MKKIILGLFLINASVFADNSYLKCTLTNHNDKVISVRYAKSHNEFEKNVVIKDEKLHFDNGFEAEALYERTMNDKSDIYLTLFSQMYIVDSTKKDIIFMKNFDKDNSFHKGPFSKKFYACRKATYFEKLKMKLQ